MLIEFHQCHLIWWRKSKTALAFKLLGFFFIFSISNIFVFLLAMDHCSILPSCCRIHYMLSFFLPFSFHFSFPFPFHCPSFLHSFSAFLCPRWTTALHTESRTYKIKRGWQVLHHSIANPYAAQKFPHRPTMWRHQLQSSRIVTCRPTRHAHPTCAAYTMPVRSLSGNFLASLSARAKI